MSQRFKVLSYNADQNYHLCQDEHCCQHRVDLMVCGKLPEETTPESLVGQTVECEYTHPFIVIAEGVSLISANKGGDGREPVAGSRTSPPHGSTSP